ncbi:DUF4294 domain-containing protein [uncultured Bacteroides sp.]|uniref:DUF4294 domain-containing protein n=1 Tax=uncultured Bacteroides sp. TaxID=162156 RepID=UPI002AABC245|nr:DUF4294 domain-containing protein [uncultured Bacteroides sp.]
MGKAQKLQTKPDVQWVEACVYQGDTIPFVQLRNIYIYPPLKFKTQKEWQDYYRLVYNVKKIVPLSIMIHNTIIETYEYIQTLPNEKAKKAHLKRVEKGLKDQYTAQLKRLSYTQGKLLIKLIDRECNQSSYEIIKVFMGSFRAGFYQTFASLFGVSLKKEYNAGKDDSLTERVITLAENGQI